MRDINYYDEVFKKLIDFKENHNLKDVSEIELYKLQIQIEKLTMDFNENDIYNLHLHPRSLSLRSHSSLRLLYHLQLRTSD